MPFMTRSASPMAGRLPGISTWRISWPLVAPSVVAVCR